MEIIVEPGDSLVKFVNSDDIFEKINLTDCINYVKLGELENFFMLLRKKVRIYGRITLKCLDHILLAKAILQREIDDFQLSLLIQNKATVIDEVKLTEIANKYGFEVMFYTYDHIYYTLILERRK